jgi:hypothetical protein
VSEAETAVWRALQAMSTDFPGSFKAENYESDFEELLIACKVKCH